MDPEISAIVLAAGESRRMGQPKLLLPWGKTTVLGKVVSTFAAAFSSMADLQVPSVAGGWEIIVVTGGARDPVEALVSGFAQRYPIRTVYNQNFAQNQMLGSLQTGLLALGASVRAAIIGLGDQPQVRQETIRNLYSAYSRSGTSLIVPSFQQRRGHPWLVARPLWAEILALSLSSTPHQFMNEHAGEIEYIQADVSILQDLDTPEDYQRLRP